MDGKRRSPHPFDLLKKIGELTRSIIEDLCNGRSPTLYIDQFSSYCTGASGSCCCNYNLPKGKEVLALQRDSQARRFGEQRILRNEQSLEMWFSGWMSITGYCNCCKKTSMARKEIFITCTLQFLKLRDHTFIDARNFKNKLLRFFGDCFLCPHGFSVKCKAEQSVVDKAINDICILLQCSRHNLNVVSVGKGLVMGWLGFKEAGMKFDCINSPSTAYHIPVHVEDVEDIVSVSEYILIVEKESVFQRLANDQFCRQNRCIVVTGRGYPDVSTRRFLHLLVETLHLPVYCLIDCDPYGIDILTTFRFGSMGMAYEAKSLRLPEIRWLGAFLSDCEKYQLSHQCLLPMTAEDKLRAKGMLRRCYMEREVPQWRSELQLLLGRGVKFEIEALSAHSLTFLTENYLPRKIQEGAYI